MATFTTIPDTDLDANSPITEPMMLALRDNPVAIASGDATAPKIQTAAIQDSAISTSKIATNAITNDKMTDNSIGNAELKKSFLAESFWSISTGGYYVVPAGYYFVEGNMQIFVNSTWVATGSGFIMSDGVKVRIDNSGGAARNFYYLKLA